MTIFTKLIRQNIYFIQVAIDKASKSTSWEQNGASFGIQLNCQYTERHWLQTKYKMLVFKCLLSALNRVRGF